MINVLTQAWHWLTIFDWNKTGGESFVQIWTALNVAFIAWDKFQEALNVPRRRCEAIIDRATCSYLDNQTRILVVDLFRKTSVVSIKLHEILIRICYVCALIAALIGFDQLYTARYGSWDIYLVCPMVFYVGFSLIAWGAFWVFAKITAVLCRVVEPRSSELQAQSEQLLANSRPPRINVPVQPPSASFQFVQRPGAGSGTPNNSPPGTIRRRDDNQL